MITLILTVLVAWLGFNVLAIAALIRHGNKPSTIRRREVRRLETLWALS